MSPIRARSRSPACVELLHQDGGAAPRLPTLNRRRTLWNRVRIAGSPLGGINPHARNAQGVVSPTRRRLPTGILSYIPLTVRGGSATADGGERRPLTTGRANRRKWLISAPRKPT